MNVSESWQNQQTIFRFEPWEQIIDFFCFPWHTQTASHQTLSLNAFSNCSFVPKPVPRHQPSQWSCTFKESHIQAWGRPSLLGWRSLLLGWKPSLVGWRPSLLGWRQSLLGWRPSLLRYRPSLLLVIPRSLSSRAASSVNASRARERFNTQWEFSVCASTLTASTISTPWFALIASASAGTPLCTWQTPKILHCPPSNRHAGRALNSRYPHANRAASLSDASVLSS